MGTSSHAKRLVHVSSITMPKSVPPRHQMRYANSAPTSMDDHDGEVFPRRSASDCCHNKAARTPSATIINTGAAQRGTLSVCTGGTDPSKLVNPQTATRSATATTRDAAMSPRTYPRVTPRFCCAVIATCYSALQVRSRTRQATRRCGCGPVDHGSRSTPRTTRSPHEPRYLRQLRAS